MSQTANIELDIDDQPHEACGIIGIFAPNEDVARMAYFGIYALQHRGQEAAGIAVSDGQTARLHKDVGLVSQVFNPQNLAPLHGHYAIGHTRYSTTGSSRLRNAPPFLIQTQYVPLTAQLARCSFEHVYFSRPDSVWEGISVHQARQRLGEELAREAPTEADVVIPVPDSSVPAAIGYARVSHVPYNDGFIKNRYIGRTFIQPTDSLRRQGVALKFNA